MSYALTLLQDIISYSSWSLVIGLLLTIMFVVLMFVIIKGFYPKSTFTPLSFVVGAVLTVFLAYRMIILCGAIGLKSLCDDYAAYINSLLPAGTQYLPIPITKEQVDDLLAQSLEEFPIIGSFVGSGEFTGHTTADIAQSMADTLNSFLNQYIVSSLLWSVAYLIIAAAIVVWTIKKSWDNRMNGGRSATNYNSANTNYRAGHTSNGHARSTRYRR